MNHSGDDQIKEIKRNKYTTSGICIFRECEQRKNKKKKKKKKKRKKRRKMWLVHFLFLSERKYVKCRVRRTNIP